MCRCRGYVDVLSPSRLTASEMGLSAGLADNSDIQLCAAGVSVRYLPLFNMAHNRGQYHDPCCAAERKRQCSAAG